MKRLPVLKDSLITLVAGLVLTGCAVGPDYRSPEPPKDDIYTPFPLPPETASATGKAGLAQRFVPRQDIPAQWWTLFHSEPLDQLVRQAISGSPTLEAAQATLRRAKEDFNARAGTEFYPSVDIKASASRQKVSGASFGQPNVNLNAFDLYNASVNVTYLLDVFGGGRRELEALQSQVDYQRFQMEGAYLTLTSNVVTAAIQEASLREQIRATREILALQEKQLKVVNQQFELGAIARTDVLAQQVQLAQTRTTLPPLEKALDQNRHLLAVLVGKFPNEASGMPQFTIDELQLPQELPVSLPSLLVRQRPDIRASEALLHAASAQIGVATANLYPQITLTGSYGTESTPPGTLFGSGTDIWSLGSGLTQPLFHGGELNARKRGAEASYDAAAALYKETVLTAFQNVADVLRALDADADTLRAQADAEAAAGEALAMAQRQFEVGAVSYLSLLNAQRQYQQARISLAQAQAARYADTAALFQALGGGWWNRSP